MENKQNINMFPVDKLKEQLNKVVTEGTNKEYQYPTLDKLKSVVEEVFGKEDFNILGITKINEGCYQIEGNNGNVFLTGRLGVLEYIKAFQNELAKYSNTIQEDGK